VLAFSFEHDLKQSTLHFKGEKTSEKRKIWCCGGL